MNSAERLRDDFKVLADRYEVPEFIKSDPVQFPHQYKTKQDIEISGFISAWLAYGSRKVFISLLNEIHAIMDNSPYDFIKEENFNCLRDNRKTMYRFCKWHDLYEVCRLLKDIYSAHDSMEDWLINAAELPLVTLQKKFGYIPQLPVYQGTSACKKLHMFLRWMIRRDSPVDFGIWRKYDPADLSVPVDVHVLKQAQLWNITQRKQADSKTVEEITAFGRMVFPEDPARLDFVLYQPPDK